MKADIRGYVVQLRGDLDQRYHPTPELSARPALLKLLTAAAAEHSGLRITAEPGVTAAVGRPDFVVKTIPGLSVGYVETKAPGRWSELERALESEQLRRYRAQLRNLLLTDYVHAILLRDGEEVGRASLLPQLAPAKEQLPSQDDVNRFAALLSQFLAVSPEPVQTPERLATTLASYAVILRLAMADQLRAEDADGPLRTLLSYFEKYLQPGTSQDAFADAIAQAVTYSLVVARMQLKAGEPLSIRSAPALMPDSLAFLRAFVKLVEDTEALSTVEWALREVCDVLVSVSDDVLRRAGKMGSSTREDAVIYFYEKFLEAYDRDARIDRGVYYTPPPLVEFIVRSVDFILRRDFGLQRGLADSRVTLLDPACGTGTFLVSAAAKALDTVETEDGAQFVASAVQEHVLRHFIGFELQPCPYTISHIKLTAFLAGRAPSIRKKLLGQLRVRVYLSNTVSPPGLVTQESGGASLPIIREVVQEGIRANEVKQKERILVIVGNPPYKRDAHNKNDFIDGLLRDFFLVDGRPIDERNTTPLQSDELRFMRWAVWKLIQNAPGGGHGVIAFVTNHAFVRRRLHRGVRKHLLDNLTKSSSSTFSATSGPISVTRSTRRSSHRCSRASASASSCDARGLLQRLSQLACSIAASRARETPNFSHWTPGRSTTGTGHSTCQLHHSTHSCPDPRRTMTTTTGPESTNSSVTAVLGSSPAPISFW